MASERFVLEVPSVPAYVGTARLFAAAVARHFRVEETEVEDLKLAVSEACTMSIRLPGDAEPVRLVATLADRRLRVEVQGAAVPGLSSSPRDTDEVTAALGLEVARALFPDAEMLDRPEGGATIAFSVPIGPGTDREG